MLPVAVLELRTARVPGDDASRARQHVLLRRPRPGRPRTSTSCSGAGASQDAFPASDTCNAESITEGSITRHAGLRPRRRRQVHGRLGPAARRHAVGRRPDPVLPRPIQPGAHEHITNPTDQLAGHLGRRHRTTRARSPRRRRATRRADEHLHGPGCGGAASGGALRRHRPRQRQHHHRPAAELQRSERAVRRATARSTTTPSPGSRAASTTASSRGSRTRTCPTSLAINSSGDQRVRRERRQQRRRRQARRVLDRPRSRDRGDRHRPGCRGRRSAAVRARSRSAVGMTRSTPTRTATSARGSGENLLTAPRSPPSSRSRARWATSRATRAARSRSSRCGATTPPRAPGTAPAPGRTSHRVTRLTVFDLIGGPGASYASGPP